MYVYKKSKTKRRFHLMNKNGTALLCSNDIKITKKYTRVTLRPVSAKFCGTCSGTAGNIKKDKVISSSSFYKSWAWKEVRYKTLKRYGNKCMCCGSRDRVVVDHIKPRSVHPKLELDEDNLQVLCNDCNMGKGKWDETDFR